MAVVLEKGDGRRVEEERAAGAFSLRARMSRSVDLPVARVCVVREISKPSVCLSAKAQEEMAHDAHSACPSTS